MRVSGAGSRGRFCPLGGAGLRPGTRDTCGEGPWATGRPRPRQGLLGTLPARRWPPLRATSSLPVLPPGLPPGWGREPAAAAGLGEPGGCRLGRGSGARREAEDDPVRVGQRSAGQSVSLEGRPLSGVGRPGDGAGGIRARRRRAGWAGRGDRLVRMAGRDEPPWEGPVTPRGKRGPGPCPPSVPSAGPWEPRGLCGRPGRPGWAAGRRRWPGAFQE